MILKSEVVQLVFVEHKEGLTKEGENYSYNKLYYNLPNGVQENIKISDNLCCKVQKNCKAVLYIEKNDRWYYLKDLEEVK